MLAKWSLLGILFLACQLRCEGSDKSRFKRRLLPDKGKPVARRGRKATGQATRLIAGLPKEGRPRAPREHGGLPRTGGPLCYREPPLLVVPPSSMIPPQPASNDA